MYMYDTKSYMEKSKFYLYEFLFQLLVGMLFALAFAFLGLRFNVSIGFLLFGVFSMYFYKAISSIPYFHLLSWRFTPQWLKNLIMDSMFKSQEGARLKVKAFYDDLYKVQIFFLYGGRLEDVRDYFSNPDFLQEVPVYFSGFVKVAMVKVGDGEEIRVPMIVLWIKNPRDFLELSNLVSLMSYLILKDLNGISLTKKTFVPFAAFQTYWLQKLWFFLSKGLAPDATTKNIKLVSSDETEKEEEVEEEVVETPDIIKNIS